MSFSFVQYTSAGEATYNVTFAYLSKSHVTVKKNGTSVTFTWDSGTIVRPDVVPLAGDIIEIRRSSSPAARLVDHADASVLTESALDNDALQQFYLAQEAFDSAANSIQLASDGTYDALSKRIKNVANANNANDAVNKSQLDAAVVAAGNVPTPANPADDNKVLRANGGVWAWASFVISMITDTAAFMKTFLATANKAAAVVALDGATLVSANDTTPGYLNGKLVAGRGISSLEEVSDGADEDLKLHVVPYVEVRQTALTGAADANGRASFLTTGSGLRPGLDASPTSLVLTFANGYDDNGPVNYVSRLTADAADPLGADLPASNTSFLHATYSSPSAVTWGSAIVVPQYSDAFLQTSASILNFEGADASTSIIDDFGATWSVVGNAQLDTAQFKFGTASLLLDGTGDGILSNSFTSLHPIQNDSWTLECWVRWNALPGAGTNQFVMLSQNGSAFGVQLFLNNNVGTTKLLLGLSSNGSSNDIANNTAGTKTAWSANQWYHIAVSFDGLAGKYLVYVDGVQDQSVSSTTRICAVAQTRLGSDSAAGQALNGWIDGFRFLPAALYPNGTTFTPPASAPSVTNYPVHWFSLPEMKMYEVTGASAAAGTNPAVTQRNRVVVGEAITDASTVTAVRSYAYRGRFAGLHTGTPVLGTPVSFSHFIGVAPLRTTMSLVNKTSNRAYGPGDRIHADSSFDATGNHAHMATRNGIQFNIVTGLPVADKAGAAGGAITLANWNYELHAERGW